MHSPEIRWGNGTPTCRRDMGVAISDRFATGLATLRPCDAPLATRLAENKKKQQTLVLGLLDQKKLAASTAVAHFQ